MKESIIVILILLGGSLIPSFIIGMVGYTSIKALGLNPSSASRIQIKMLLAFIFAIVISFASLLVIFYVYAPRNLNLHSSGYTIPNSK